MRLHRILTFNLNSLYGEQELNLDRDLNGASLFLIHGRTGSGKSTLTDAVSLALFGKTPRLDGRHGVLDADPCNVMSRGTGECRAEVEFSRLLADGSRVRYRAIWSVRRARKRPEGALQSIERSLERFENGEWVVLPSGRQKKVFEAALMEALDGFSFEDFQRSMLLAQGRFDELLSAAPEKRAGILERLTNTREYSLIGSNAAALASAHRKNLEFLRRQLGDSSPVSEAERSSALEAVRLAQTEVERCHLELTKRQQSLIWWNERERLCDELGKLENERVELVTLTEQLASLKDQVKEYERCTIGFDALERVTSLEKAFVSCGDTIVRKREEYTAVAKDCQEKRLRRDVSLSEHHDAEKLLHALQLPCAEQIQLRDKAYKEKTALDRLQQELQKTKDSFQKASNDVAKAVEALGAANQNAESAQLTLETRAHYRTLRKLWNDEWQERCVLLVEEESRFGVEVVELAKGEQTFGNNQAAHEVKLKEHVERTRTLLAEPQTRVRASAELLVALTHGELPVEKRGALRRTFEELQALVEQTRVAERELGELDTMDKEVARATAESKEIESSVTLTNTEALRLREQASHAAERQRDAETQAYRLELIGHIATKRGALRHGEACPLCGSVEHPYVTQPEHCPDDTTIQNQISNARIELARRTEEARGAEVVARDAEQLASGRKQALDGAERLRQTLGEKLRMRVAVVTETLRRAQLPVDCGRAFCNEQLTARCERLEEIKNALVELEAVIDESVCAEREVVKVENELRQEANVLEAERLALFEQSRTLVERREKLFSAKRTLNEGRESLKMALLPFVVELSQSGGAGDVSSFRLTDYKQRVEALIELLKEAELCDEQAKSRQREAALRVEVAEQARKNAEERLADAQRQELEQRAICQELCKQGQELRNKIFGIWATRKYGATEERTQPEPKNSAEVLERAKVLFEQLAEVAAQARLVAEEASTKEAALRGELGILSQSREELQNQLGDAQVKLTAFLDSLALGSVEALRERWMNSDAFQAGRERISRLVQREHDWMTRREERQNAVERHELARPDGFVILDGPEFATSLRAAVTESSLLYNEATERERTRVLYLSELEQRAHAFSTAGERLRQAESAARPWLTLNSLIGTNEGNAFRQFAQGLNLHRLIQKANVHLRRLSERYRLTQAKNGEELTLEFAIIDRWQVGEPRSTRSLSGGERFLVSLALALGLSDLRTHTLPIETLLLDEGFGTLDPETLETALAALQCLQVDGRQVGVISHVAGLKERILAQVRIIEEGTGRSRIVV